MLSKVLLLALPLATLGALSGGFNYDLCDSIFGPKNWPGTCQAQTQTSGTPINLCGGVPFPHGAPELKFSGYSAPRVLNVYNDGASLGLNVGGSFRPTLSLAQSLSFTVGRSTVPGPQTWTLQNIHLHWGRKGVYGEGSEHYLEGEQFEAEAHFVHYNSRFANFSQAVSSGASDALLVVGVFLEADDDCQEPAAITAIANAVATATKTPQPLDRPILLSDIVDGKGHYYSYAGSLTTPTCSEIVTWVVMKTPKKVNTKSLNKIWQASTTPGEAGGELISLHGNYRPLQPLLGRTVYYTGPFSRSCRKVEEPEVECHDKH